MTSTRRPVCKFVQLEVQYAGGSSRTSLGQHRHWCRQRLNVASPTSSAKRTLPTPQPEANMASASCHFLMFCSAECRRRFLLPENPSPEKILDFRHLDQVSSGILQPAHHLSPSRIPAKRDVIWNSSRSEIFVVVALMLQGKIFRVRIPEVSFTVGSH